MFVFIKKMTNGMSKTNGTKHIKWHETCKCKCRLDASVCHKSCDFGEYLDYENCKCRK